MAIQSSDISSLYQSALGRAPTSGETASMLQYANNGSVPLTSMDLQQMLQSTPEYQQSQLNRYGGQYSQALGASDARILGLSQNAITQQFASQGRNMGSSGYINAYANAAANLAQSRQQQLAAFYGGGYQNIMGNTQQQGNAAQSFGQGQQASTLGWNRQMALLSMQGDAQQRALRQGGILNLQNGLTNAGIDLGKQAIGGLSSYGGGLFSGGGGGAPYSGGTGSGMGLNLSNIPTPNYSGKYASAF